jgi:hypothetical protein
MTVSEVLRSRWTWGGAAALALIGAFGAGRYMAPTKVEVREVEKVVEVVKWRDKEVITKGPVTVVTKTRTVPGPAGPTIEVEKVVTREKVVTVHTQGVDTVTEVERLSEKVVERDAPRWTVFGTVGAGFNGSGLTAPAYGGGVAFRFLGPLTAVVQAEGGSQGGSARIGLGAAF